MALQPGTTLGPYQVTAKIGEGGMGEVYRATDTSLDRQVAIKVRPDAFASDAERLARFEREAKVLASLNHPNIGAIYGLEKSGDTRALVLELVEGPTLADRIKQGPIPLDEALPIAKQIAEALEAAHEQGIIHRDLKPANIKVKDDGTVKVLDFGLAKAFQPDASDPNMSQSPTISLTAAATQIGMVIGTAAYMAPEQASGKVVDKRADVWAFGVVLYEMLTGTRPFVGDDVSKTLAHVIAIDPDWSTLPKSLPPVLGTFLRGCLEKNPKQRVHDVADVRLAMEGAFETTVTAPSEPTAVRPRQLWQQPVLASVGGLMLLVIGGLGLWQLTRSAPLAPIRIPISVESLAVRTHGAGSVVALSPDGRRLAYVSGDGASGQLYVRRLDAFDAAPITGADDAYSPFFSPDGEWIGFATSSGELKKVRLAAGAPVTVTTIAGDMHGATWGPDDTIVYSERDLRRVSALGGPSETILSTDISAGETTLSWPSFLPDGDAVLFTGTAPPGRALHVSVLSLETGEVHRLLERGGNAQYAPTGHLVHAEGGSIFATPFDADQRRLTGRTFALLEGVAMGLPREGAIAHYDVSTNGALVYLPGEFNAPETFGGRRLVWVDRDGAEELLTTPSERYRTLSLSPDNRRAAVGIDGRSGGVGSGNIDVWVSDLARGSLARLTTDEAFDSDPLWSLDGRRVVFASNRNGQPELLWRAADGSGAAERVLAIDESATSIIPYDWSPDGASLFVQAEFPETGRDIGMGSVGQSTTWEPLIQTAADEWSPDLSPDGRWLAYTSDETGYDEVYVLRFPELEGRQVISLDGGIRPTWSDDGRELLYLRQRWPAPPDAVMRVPLDLAQGDPPSLIVGTPERLLDWRFYSPRTETGGRHHDVSSDGQRMLAIMRPVLSDTGGTETAGFSQLNLILNWFQELTERVPVN